jgi:hypothetical protein
MAAALTQPRRPCRMTIGYRNGSGPSGGTFGWIAARDL